MQDLYQRFRAMNQPDLIESANSGRRNFPGQAESTNLEAKIDESEDPGYPDFDRDDISEDDSEAWKRRMKKRLTKNEIEEKADIHRKIWVKMFMSKSDDIIKRIRYSFAGYLQEMLEKAMRDLVQGGEWRIGFK